MSTSFDNLLSPINSSSGHATNASASEPSVRFTNLFHLNNGDDIFECLNNNDGLSLYATHPIEDHFSDVLRKWNWAHIYCWGGLDQFNSIFILTIYNDNIIMCDWEGNVHFFAIDGTFLQQWGGERSYPKKINKGKGIVVSLLDGNEVIIIADGWDYCIKVFSFEGELLSCWDKIPIIEHHTEFLEPTGIAVSPNKEEIFVSYMYGNIIKVFEPNGFCLKTLDITLKYPKSISISDEGKVFICNDNHVIVIDSDGKYIQRFGKMNNLLPINIAVMGSRVLVTDMYQLYEFHTNGTLIRQLDLQINIQNPFIIQGISLSSNGNFVLHTCHNYIISGRISGL